MEQREPISPIPTGIRITLTPPDAHFEGMDQVDVSGILEDRRSGTASPILPESINQQNVEMRLSPPPFRALFDESHPIAPSPLYASMMTVTGDVGRDVGNTSPHEPPYGTLSTVGSIPPISGLHMGVTNTMVIPSDQIVGQIGTRSLASGILHPGTINAAVPPFVTPSISVAIGTTIATPEDISASSSRPQSEPPDLIVIDEDQEMEIGTGLESGANQRSDVGAPLTEIHSTISTESTFPKDETSLRRIIMHIQTNPTLSSIEKAKKVQQLMMSRWTSKRNANPSATIVDKTLLLDLSGTKTDEQLANAIGISHVPQSPQWDMPTTMSAPNLLHDTNSATGTIHNIMVVDNIHHTTKETDELKGLEEIVDNQMGLGISAVSPVDYIEKVIRPMLTQQDLTPTTTPSRVHSQGSKVVTFGCKHYSSGCKIFTPCCMKWFPCRYCHDEEMHIPTVDTDNHEQRYNSIHQHSLPRSSEHGSPKDDSTTLATQYHPVIKYIMCQRCQQIQLSGIASCTKCGLQFGAHYTCTKCAIWENDPKKKIYHCQGCQVCRIGDPAEYFHCTKCDCCLRVDLRGNHKCIEKNLHCDCPICGEYLFYSTTSIIFMPCGHAIHYLCHQKHTANSYQCPICWKSLVNMKVYFARLDQMLAEHKMPEEYASVMSNILCNDCEKRSSTSYHFMYHKCRHCGSYNTKLLSTFVKDQNQIQSNTDNIAIHDQDTIMNIYNNADIHEDENAPPS